MAKELELKLSLGAQAIDGIQDRLELLLNKLLQATGSKPEWKQRNLINYYYDTPGFDLNQRKMALRIRDTGEGFVQTLKTKGKSVNGISERGEWEWMLENPSLQLELLNSLEEWPDDIEVAALDVVFETNFLRKQCDIEIDGNCFELALDMGEVRSKGKALSINELELELKDGDVSCLSSLGRQFAEALNAKPSDISKAERGYQLFQA